MGSTLRIKTLTALKHYNFVKCKAFCVCYCQDVKKKPRFKSARVDLLLEGLLNGKRSSLAAAITLVESQHPGKQKEAQLLLSKVMKEMKSTPHEQKGIPASSFRIGVTGPPGAGKSTFIESLGKLITSTNRKIAVLTVDPSSLNTGGSLLGDKTRMTELSCDSLAYIRPSPTSGFLGGVTRTTNEAILLCECAGFNTVIVETVGVGQSEIDIAHMVDMFILIVPPAGGDELQALKKGVVELVDLIVINKADGNLLSAAQRIQAEYVSALKFIKKTNPLWKVEVMKISALYKEGIKELWEKMCNFHELMLESGELEIKRGKQYKKWMWSHIQNHLLSVFKNHPNVQIEVKQYEEKLMQGLITPWQASDYLVQQFLK